MAEVLVFLTAVGVGTLVANRIVELMRNVIRLRNEWLERTPRSESVERRSPPKP